MNRHCLTRLLAVGVVGAFLLLAGCATDRSSENAWRPNAKNAVAGRDQSAGTQADADSFPSARQVGLEAHQQ
jgi:hypothetical protein